MSHNDHPPLLTLTEATRLATMTWRTMDTAPKDRFILLKDGENVSVAKWEPEIHWIRDETAQGGFRYETLETGWWQTYADGVAAHDGQENELVVVRPTHWMPLP